MTSYAMPTLTVEEFENILRKMVREEVTPAVSAAVTESVIQAAREAARCAMTDEIDYISEKGNELFNQATKAGRPPSTFKG